MSGSEASEAVTKFVAEMTFDTLSDDAVERAKRSVLDLFACAALGMGAGAVEPARRYVMKHAPGAEATIYFGGGSSAGRRGGTDSVSTGRFRWVQYHKNKNNRQQ